VVLVTAITHAVLAAFALCRVTVAFLVSVVTDLGSLHKVTGYIFIIPGLQAFLQRCEVMNVFPEKVPMSCNVQNKEMLELLGVTLNYKKV
jgi:hypothetical protein